MVCELYLNKAVTQKEKCKAMSPQWRLKKKKSEGERGKFFFTDECQLINSEEKDSIRKIIILQYQCNKCFKQEVSTDGKTIRWKMIGEQESQQPQNITPRIALQQGTETPTRGNQSTPTQVITRALPAASVCTVPVGTSQTTVTHN